MGRSFSRRHLERPEAGPGEVLVRVVVAGTNPVDAKLRADGAFAGLEPPVVLGSDVSGVVEEVGAGAAPDLELLDLYTDDRNLFALALGGLRENVPRTTCTWRSPRPRG